MILPDSIVNTGGYSSYPATTYILGCEHNVVNLSEGFVQSIEPTNNIKGLLAHMKSTMRKEHSVKWSVVILITGSSNTLLKGDI